jgi:hypothetical protein
MQFAAYVNKNSEQLRSLFVEHQERKINLIVQDFQREHQWDNFFDAMKARGNKLISNHQKSRNQFVLPWEKHKEREENLSQS